jgi:8-oxo-dGTP pyrophosphatase MutT (NUDIX family)
MNISDTSRPVTPEPAATVVLLRESDAGLEVYLTRRQDNLAFLGGFHVFPGGKLDTKDREADTMHNCGDFEKNPERYLLPGEHPLVECIAYHVAAIRELFEEAGVLLAYDMKGNPVRGDDEELWQRLRQARKKIHALQMCMTDLMRQEDLVYAVDKLVWLSRWITPASSPRRFDTQFFLARLPEGQSPRPFTEEISDSGWICPAEAINKWRMGEIKIIPPTLASLDALVNYESWSQVKDDLLKKAGKF